MFKKIKNSFYQLESFRKQKEIIHGFSGRELGDMSSGGGQTTEENRKRFLDLLGLDQKDLVLMEQVHKDKVEVVDNSGKEKILAGIDGMIIREKGIILGVKVADCLPILFYDPFQRIIGIGHGGWKGVLTGLMANILEKMRDLGAKPENILVGIGPHIGGCCYTILPKRAKAFQKEFGDLPGMIYKESGKLHLDLAVPIIWQLEKMGVKKKNIEIALTCTSCQNQDFFSFRKEKTNDRMLGVISLID